MFRGWLLASTKLAFQGFQRNIFKTVRTFFQFLQKLGLAVSCGRVCFDDEEKEEGDDEEIHEGLDKVTPVPVHKTKRNVFSRMQIRDIFRTVSWLPSYCPNCKGERQC